MADAANIPEAIGELTNFFTDAELKIIRTGLPFSEKLALKIRENIAELAKNLFSQHPHPPVVRSLDEVPNTFLFRAALCSILWARLDFCGWPQGCQDGENTKRHCGRDLCYVRNLFRRIAIDG